MAEQLDDLLRQAIAAARDGRAAEAQRLLSAVLSDDPFNEAGWLWMSAVVTSPADRIRCLQRVTAINPENEMALKGLRMLDAEPDGRTIRRDKLRKPAKADAPAETVELAAEEPPEPAPQERAEPVAEAQPEPEPADEMDLFAAFEETPFTEPIATEPTPAAEAVEPVAPVEAAPEEPAPKEPAGAITDADLFEIFGPPPSAEPGAPVAPEEPASEERAPEKRADDLPDWVTPPEPVTRVQTLADIHRSEADEPSAAEPVTPVLPEEPAPEEPADELPDWMEFIEPVADVEPIATVEPVEAVEPPPAAEPVTTEAPAEHAPAVYADGIPDWLQVTDPVEAVESPPPAEPVTPVAAAEPAPVIDLDEMVGAPPEGEESSDTPAGLPLIGEANVARAQREAETVIEAIREARRLREPVIQWRIPKRRGDA